MRLINIIKSAFTGKTYNDKQPQLVMPTKPEYRIDPVRPRYDPEKVKESILRSQENFRKNRELYNRTDPSKRAELYKKMYPYDTLNIQNIKNASKG